MKQLNICAKLSKLVERVSKGERLVITKSGIRLARLVPLNERHGQKIESGRLAGQVGMPDDLDAPLAEEPLAAFAGKSDFLPVLTIDAPDWLLDA